MICPICKKSAIKSIYNPISKTWSCKDCRDPNIIHPIRMDPYEYVHQEACEIVKDKKGIK
uniref:Uncharacterized protein n=1 Tax=viral metagenome TaxID=1070528 RepID=A0A6M3JZ24_9ZZZZ